MSNFEDRLTKLEEKLDFVIQQQNLSSQKDDATQRAIALLKADFREIIKESMHSVLHKRAVEGYSKVAGGR